MKSAGMAGDPSYADLARPPLPVQRIRDAALRVPPWRELHVLAEAGSTSDVVATAARAGQPEGLVVVAEQQTGGRGRLGREWVSPPRAGLTFSVLLRPAAPADRWPTLPLLAGVALARALGERTGLDVRLKWPNDLLVADRKLGGILAEVAGGAVVVGIGVNVSTTAEELPGPPATSVAIELAGEPADRTPLLLAALRHLGPLYEEWQRVDGAPDAVLPAYRELCATLGRDVRVTMPAGVDVVGVADSVDDDGCLVVRRPDGSATAVSAGDVVHVRPE
ncbi:MAG TPA: biotin--[acetyl-CoA-carboxylase] ligase [Mycobacteriales bacterium]|nr:biotin--[acetyl-CoA-carboxylase] ligase [Mycobacteriales bacterium]